MASHNPIGSRRKAPSLRAGSDRGGTRRRRRVRNLLREITAIARVLRWAQEREDRHSGSFTALVLHEDEKESGGGQRGRGKAKDINGRHIWGMEAA